MARIRFNPSASVITTETGIQLRSDLNSFQVDGSDVEAFTSLVMPLLDGSYDKDEVVAQLKQYSSRSVIEFLDLLQSHGLLKIVSTESEAETTREQERFNGQQEFFRKWTERPEAMDRRLRKARVLLVGLEPWGVRAASALIASGVGTIHIIDDGLVAPGDLQPVGILTEKHLAHSRAQEVANELGASASRSRVTASVSAFSEDLFLSFTDAKWDLVICAPAPDDLFAFRATACFAHSHRLVSLFACLERLNAVVGPLVIPGETACWNCCRLRRLSNSGHAAVDHALQTALLAQRPKPRRRTYVVPMPNLLGELLALESLKHLTGFAPSVLSGSLLVQDLVTLKTSLHRVIRMPWCDVCGGAATRDDRHDLQRRRNGSQNGKEAAARLNNLRDCDELRALLTGWIDERTGIIRHLSANPPDAAKLDFVWTSTALVSGYSEGKYKPAGLTAGLGKGLSIAEAAIGAVAEAIERYSAARCRKQDLYSSTLSYLREECLDPRLLCLYEESRYGERNFPYARFSPDLKIDWTRGKWLDSGEAVWLPALTTYYGLEVSPEENFCQVTSSGLATGTSVDDATLRAVFELIERDAFMLTWLSRRSAQLLLPDETLDKGAREIIDQLEARGLEVKFYLLDVGIPICTILCLVLGEGRDWPGATVALASHLSPRLAVRKSILEQGLVGLSIRRQLQNGEMAIPRRVKDVRTPMDHALYYVPRKRASLFDFLYEGVNKPVCLADLPEPKTISLAECTRRLSKANIRVAVKDVTSPDVRAASPFRVVRALGPLLQPIYFGSHLPRLASPRLKLMLKNGLNPYPHPMA